MSLDLLARSEEVVKWLNNIGKVMSDRMYQAATRNHAWYRDDGVLHPNRKQRLEFIRKYAPAVLVNALPEKTLEVYLDTIIKVNDLDPFTKHQVSELLRELYEGQMGESIAQKFLEGKLALGIVGEEPWIYPYLCIKTKDVLFYLDKEQLVPKTSATP